MDLLKLIREKIEVFAGTDRYLGLKSVVIHIEIAERHFIAGRDGADYLFNDVIYRTNQGFEGSLKEAYAVLTGNSAEKKSLAQIEQYFEKEGVLRDRVLVLFSNYRTDWRNKSTHDHKLYFSEQEAFLAIVNICAFYNILLDQMMETLAYGKEKESLRDKQPRLPDGYSEQSFVDQVIELLSEFSKEISRKVYERGTPLLEKEVIGMLFAFLNTADSEIVLRSEYPIPMGAHHQAVADAYLEKDGEGLIIELKTSTKSIGMKRHGREQLISLLAASGLDTGVLFILPVSPNQEIVSEKTSVEIGDNRFTIIELYPKNVA